MGSTYTVARTNTLYQKRAGFFGLVVTQNTNATTAGSHRKINSDVIVLEDGKLEKDFVNGSRSSVY